MTRRMERVNVLLREEISRIVVAELRDPRLSKVITVTRVDTSRDLSRSWVYISVMGKQDHKDDTLKALKSASGFCVSAKCGGMRSNSPSSRTPGSISAGSYMLAHGSGTRYGECGS